MVEQEILQHDLAINTTVGILGIFDPATKLGFEDQGKEDFGQTLGDGVQKVVVILCFQF